MAGLKVDPELWVDTEKQSECVGHLRLDRALALDDFVDG